jgi:hypothetical protein
MAKSSGWERAARAAHDADAARRRALPAREDDVEPRASDARPSFLPPSKIPLSPSARFGIVLAGVWVVGITFTLLANRYVRDMSCLFDPSNLCREGAEDASGNITFAAFGILVIATALSYVLFRVARRNR